MKWLIRFKVSGRMSFPLDMLRYDGCWPLSQHDVSQMAASLDPHSRRDMAAGEKFTAEMMTYGRIKDWKPTEDRWASFGWEVDKTSIHYTKL